jgi:mono/diheme cytochrome c family protein
MRVLPKTLKNTIGVIILTSLVSVASADPNTSYNGNTGSNGGGTNGGTGTTEPYTIPKNFNFNCNTRNPKSDAIENGRRAYVRLNCNVCHSNIGHGNPMGPSLVGAGDDVAEAVTQGQEGGMPSFKKYLCPNDLADLKAYIDFLGSAASPDFTDWWVANPPAPFVNSAP